MTLVGILLGLLFFLVVWWAPSILIFRTANLSLHVRVPWAVGSLASMLVPSFVGILALALLPEPAKSAIRNALLFSSGPVSFSFPWLTYYLFRRKFRAVAMTPPATTAALPADEQNPAIDGTSTESFRTSFAALQTRLTPAQRTQLRNKLILIYQRRFPMRSDTSVGSANVYSAEALREQLHGLTFSEALALHEDESTNGA